MATQNEDLRKMKDQVMKEYQKDTVGPVDFLIFNRNATRQLSTNSSRYRLLVFQRCVRRLQLLMNKHEEIYDFVPPTHTLISQLNGKSEFFFSTEVIEALM